jgi:N-acetylmuramoyl-L-alanine amidase
MIAQARNVAAALLAGMVMARSTATAEESGSALGNAIVVAGQAFQVGRPVVLWRDPEGFDAYQTRCIDQSGGCCDGESKRYGVRKGVEERSLAELQAGVSQLVLHFDGCVNSRSCF